MSININESFYYPVSMTIVHRHSIEEEHRERKKSTTKKLPIDCNSDSRLDLAKSYSENTDRCEIYGRYLKWNTLCF